MNIAVGLPGLALAIGRMVGPDITSSLIDGLSCRYLPVPLAEIDNPFLPVKPLTSVINTHKILYALIPANLVNS